MTAQSISYGWVPAAPFRAHLRLLLDLTGLPWPVVALKADVPTRLVRRLLFIDRGRRLPKLPRELAMRLIMLNDVTLSELAHTWVPADETRRQLAELLAGGYPAPELARYCRLTLSELEAALDAPRCTELTALLAHSASLQHSC